MHSPVQATSETTAPTHQPLDMGTEAQPALNQPHRAQEEEEEGVSAASTETNMVITQQKEAVMQTAEPPATVQEPDTAYQLQSERSETPAKVVKKYSALKKSAPKDDPKPPFDGQKTNMPDWKKYVPSKKAMIDPLRMDMSKPLVMPLSSSQLSLQCSDCHIIFIDNKSKVRHMKASHPAEYEQRMLRNSLFACYVCESHFPNSTELQAHQKTHLEKKPFTCPVCKMSYKKLSELTRHKNIHLGEHGFACTECGRTCKTLTLLKYHQRTHTGERPYICKECGRRFYMPNALHKHMVLHMPEGPEKEQRTAAFSACGNPAVGKYSCYICKATFKTTKLRVNHMKSKHNMVPAIRQVKQSTPIITPISISQAGLLQLETNGPLQKVDSNIDTDQIRKLIESLGNVQKVNQVVILGQVPPNAPPLEIQQISPPADPVNSDPPQIDFIGLKQPDSSTAELDASNKLFDPMEQTIILEPITPDGQLINAPFSEFGSHIGTGESIELTFVQTEQAERPVGEVMHQMFHQPEIGAPQSDSLNPMVFQNALTDDLEQTVILELTPALMPTLELEQSQPMSQEEMPSSIEPSTEFQKDPTELNVQEPGLVVPDLMTTVELELMPLETEQQVVTSCPFDPPDTLTETPKESEINNKEDEDSCVQGESQDQIPNVIEGSTPLENSEQEPMEQVTSEKQQTDQKEDQEQPAEVEDTSAERAVPSKSESQQDPKRSESPVNMMSAQELVKVRKRKPARTLIYQCYLQETKRSIRKDNLKIDPKPAKRQKTTKSHLVKFGPANKEKKCKKQKKPSQPQHPPTQEEEITANLSPKNATTPNKGKKEKKGAHLVSTTEMKSSPPPPLSTLESQQLKSRARRSKIKKKKEEAREAMKLGGHKGAASPVLKKKKQTNIMPTNQPKTAKNGKRQKSPKTKKEEVKTSPAPADTPAPSVTQESLLLLKGHKQPQLKVYKLDPAKASGQTQGSSPQQSKNVHNPANESVNNLPAGSKTQVGRTKKNHKGLSLLSSLQIAQPSPETLPTKPKTTRKRKTSSQVETEGVITSSHSKRAFDCPDCGERFSELSSLQKHKATAHVVESPGLTYTNGNIFEGVSRLDLYQLPKQPGEGDVVSAMNAGTGWDTEPELVDISLEDRERTVSFPALIPSPSLPLPPLDVEMSSYGDKRGGNGGADDHHREVSSLSEQPLNNDAPLKFTAEPALETSSKQKVLEMGEPISSDELEKSPSSESRVQAQMDEDVKEDLLLEVDLVTVGEQNEREDSAPSQESVAQDELKGNTDCGSTTTSAATGQVSETTEKEMMSQTVSCSTHQVAIKEEQEEILVQGKKAKGKGARTKNATRGRRRGMGHSKRGGLVRIVSGEDHPRGTESERGDCEVDYEKHSITSDSEAEDGTKTLQSAPTASCEAGKAPAPVPSSSEHPPEQQVVVELESVTSSVEEIRSEAEELDRESPSIILEKIIPAKQTEAVDREPSSQEIKMEENMSDPRLVATSCQNKQNLNVQHQDIQTVLVKAESSSRHTRWNVESMDNDNIATPLMQSPETTDDSDVRAEVNTNQCIFYPVKEEDRELFLGSTRTNDGRLTPEGSNAAIETELPNADDAPYDASHAAQDCLETRVRRMLTEPEVNDFGHAETESEWPHPPDLRDFLLRSSDEEDGAGSELSNPQMDSEAEVMAYFYKNRSSGARLSEQTSPSSSSSTNQLQTPRGEIRPIDYFSRYFCWDTWLEIAKCTNEQSSVPNPVTAREVAQFVGIHIAMGTLKFPSPKLYWEDLTKVPLIADAMPLLRFLKLTHTLKFASSAKVPLNSVVQKGRQADEIRTRDQILTSRHCGSSGQSQCDKLNSNRSQTPTEPLWKVQPLLSRFQAGCQSPKGDYAVDQYLLPLTGKRHNNKASLHCTTLIGFGGLLSHVDFKLNLSDKEDAVEKMVPKGSMVFLCKQELSTPAMLERLLAAGVHGAGRVVGAQGQAGDEFVTSDGKLMLRRSQCGFILSTAGSGHRNMASLIDNFEQAQMSARLNRELRNLYPIPLTASSPTCWPQTVLWYLTDQALVNSWLLYRRDHQAPAATLTLMDFRLEVSKALILSSGSDTQDSVPPQPPMEKAQSTSQAFNPSPLEESPLPDAVVRYDGSGHWPEQLAEGEGGRCRYGDCQRTSRVLCLKCCVFLCISRNHNCFLNFHHQGSFGKE